MRLLLTSSGIRNTSIHVRWTAYGQADAIDDQSAIKVTDGAVEVVTAGHWKLFTP